MNQSENLDKLLPALIKVQVQVKPVIKDDENPHFKHKFASLKAISDATRQLLADNGLAITSRMSVLPDGSTGLITTLWHVSGQWMQGEMPLLLAKEDPQGQGSAITYARRYAKAALLDLVQEDDDGNQATQSWQSSASNKRASATKSLPACLHCGEVARVMRSKYGPGYYCQSCRGKFTDEDLAEQLFEDNELVPVDGR